MCGLAAGIWYGVSSNVVRKRLDACLIRMSKRGPDDEGKDILCSEMHVIALGQRRLSVIDVSAGGHQPMWSEDGKIGLVFNGEIYNYLELKNELIALGIKFHSQSDTEVLLKSWSIWGPDVLPRIVGMFSFVLLDKNKNELYGARDAFGIKPLYYFKNEKGIGFSSEVAALLELTGEKPELNFQIAYEYLVHGSYDSDENSFFSGIKSFPAGHFFTYDIKERNFSVKAWWSPKITPIQNLNFSDAAQELRRLLLESVRLHMRSDVPLGAALSGGVDSSAIVGCMRYLEPDAALHTFSFIASGSDVSEERWVDLVNRHTRAISHKVEIQPNELARDLDDMLLGQGEPFGSTSIYAQYRVFRMAKEHGMVVTLDGQGADELCGGYVGYPGPRIRSLLETGQWKEAALFLNQWGKWPGRSNLEGLKAAVSEFTGRNIYQFLRKANGGEVVPNWIDEKILLDAGCVLEFPDHRPILTAPGRRLSAELARSLHGLGLPSLLRHGDRNSMRFSVESRVPFLTTALADFLLTLPESYLVSDKGETKHLLRHAMKGLVPEEILSRRDKIGFATPERDWLIQMSPQVRAWLRYPLHLPFLRQDAVLSIFDQVIAGKRPFSWQVWRWINFSRWYAINFGV